MSKREERTLDKEREGTQERGALSECVCLLIAVTKAAVSGSRRRLRRRRCRFYTRPINECDKMANNNNNSVKGM